MIKRQISPDVLDALAGFPVVYINGPRQAGKTTLVKALAASEWPAEYLSLDEASILGAVEANPETFLRAYDGRTILDEVQMAPTLFRVLKIIVDEARQQQGTAANGRFLLTGSANIMALPALADALVGRMHILSLYPLSALEVTGSDGNFMIQLLSNGFTPRTVSGQKPLLEVLTEATFPEIAYSSPALRRQWFESYITTILQRDVRQIAEIAKLGILPNLLKVLAARAGGLINEADIARSIGQNAVTAKSYRILLQMLFLTFDVKPWFRNTGKRLVKAAKGYLIDTGMLCHLQQIDVSKAAHNDPHVFGHILENFVATELLKQLASCHSHIELYHFRTSDGKEVDFVLEQADGTLSGLEVKARDAVTTDDFKGLRELRSCAGKDFVCGIVLYRGNRIIPFGDALWAIPLECLWEEKVGTPKALRRS